MHGKGVATALSLQPHAFLCKLKQGARARGGGRRHSKPTTGPPSAPIAGTCREGVLRSRDRQQWAARLGH